MKKGTGTLALVALSGVPLIMVLGNSMLIPVLPEMKSVLHISQFQSSLVITLFSIPAGLAIPFAGFLADRFGRKTVVVPALIVYGLGGIVAGLAAMFAQKAFFLLLSGRVIQGVGAAGTAPIAMAWAGDLYKGKERSKALGSIEAANGMGKVVSPILGSLVAVIAWYATFFVFPILCVPIALAIWFLVKEPPLEGKKQSILQYLQGIKQVFQAKLGLLFSTFFAGAVILFLLFGVLFFLSDFLESKYGMKGVRKGLILAIPVLAMASTSLLTGRLIKKNKKLMKALVILGSGLVSLALVVFPLFNNIYFYFGAIIIMGLGSGLTLPALNTMITSTVTTAKRGTITALYGGVRFIGVALGPPIFGALIKYGKFTLFWGNAGLAALVAVAAFILIKPEAIKPADQGGEAAKEGGEQEPAEDKPKQKSKLEVGRWILNSITFRNTIGHLVLRKPLPPEESEKSADKSKESEDKPEKKG